MYNRSIGELCLQYKYYFSFEKMETKQNKKRVLVSIHNSFEIQIVGWCNNTIESDLQYKLQFRYIKFECVCYAWTDICMTQKMILLITVVSVWCYNPRVSEFKLQISWNYEIMNFIENKCRCDDFRRKYDLKILLIPEIESSMIGIAWIANSIMDILDLSHTTGYGYRLIWK